MAMNSKEFVEAIKLTVRDAAIAGTIRQVAAPSGRQLPDSERLRANWFSALSEADKDMIESVVQEAVHQAVFGMLAVLDGVRTIEDSEEKGRLELWCIGQEEHLLNDPNKEFLHDIYNTAD
jgi:hypothetical protein